jgi:hypothetical protein
MKTEDLIEEVNKISDIRILLVNHPDSEMVKLSCLHYLGDEAQEWYHNKNKKNVDLNTLDISWKTVFNSNVADYYMWSDMFHAQKAAGQAGYKYFSWNTLIYRVVDCELVDDINTADLDGITR